MPSRSRSAPPPKTAPSVPFRHASRSLRRGLARSLLLAALPALLPLALHAQNAETPPARNGNIWDSIPHQPRETEVAPEERALGVAPSIAQEKALNEELDTIGKRLLEDESTHPPRIPPPPPGMN
jgi:hypothetical protein